MQTQWAKRDLIVTCSCGTWGITVQHTGHLSDAEKMTEGEKNWQLHTQRSHRADST